jgi:peptidyl-prolyl cis-trans isomerase SurA
MRRALLLSLVVLLPLAARAELVDRVAAVVNEEIVPLSEVQQRAAPELAKTAQIPDANERNAAREKIMKAALEQLVGEKLLEAKEKEEGIVVSDADVDAAIADVKRQNPGMDDATLEKALEEQQGLNMQGFRSMLRRQIGQMRLIQSKVASKVKVTDADLKSEYENMKTAQSDEFEVHARHILVPLPPHAGAAEIEAAHKKAIAIAAEVRAPGADFAAIAKKHNESSSADSGGDLGWFGRGTMVAEFERVAFSLKPGEVSDPVRTRFGWHVIKIEERRAVGVKPFEEVKAQLQEKLRRTQLEKYTEQYVAELRQNALVEEKL